MHTAAKLAESIIALEESGERDAADSEGGVPPEEARVGPIGLFRPGDEISLGPPQLDVVTDKGALKGPELGFSKIERDERGGWRRVHGSVPVDV